MKEWMVKLVLAQTRALVGAYTWTTLPFYAAVQRPWRRLAKHRDFGVRKTVDSAGRTVYYRHPSHPCDSHFFKVKTFPELFDQLNPTKPVVGIRDVFKEEVALDENGNPIMIENRVLKRVTLADKFRWMTVGQVMEHVDKIARGLREIGVKKGTKVLIYADNGIEWFYTLLALSRLNATVVTLFSTLGDSGVVYGINQSDSEFVVTSQALLPKLHSLSDKLDNKLRSIIYIPDKANPQVGLEDGQKLSEKFQVTSLCDVERSGEKVPPCKFEPPKPEDIFMIMYTSGTTGNPKGVIITHGHFHASIQNLRQMDEDNGRMGLGSTFAGYLPMAHLFGCLMNVAMFMSESPVAFCSAATLLDSSPSHVPGQVGDIRLIQPEFLVGVPLVLERILKEIYRKLAAAHPLAEPMFTYLMEYKIRWTERGFDTPIINKLICSKINQQFGGKIRLMGVSSAPIHRYTQSMIQAAMNVKVLNGYGATEMTGGAHTSSVDDIAYENVGVPYPKVKFYLEDWPEGGYSTKDQPNPRGEIVCSGDNVASGYYKLPEETAKAFLVDEDGTRWYRTGDIGEVLPNGTLKVIDRKKDLTKLANGEFISLGKIESALRAMPIVENICVCSNPYSNHLVALIVPNRNQLRMIAKSLGLDFNMTNSELCRNSKILEHVLNEVRRHSRELGLKVREIPAALRLAEEEWTQQNNLLTAAFKMRRKQVNDFYKDEIQQMFAVLDANGK